MRGQVRARVSFQIEPRVDTIRDERGNIGELTRLDEVSKQTS